MVELMELVKLLSFLKDPMVGWFVVGLFVGWNFPQPAYAKVVQDKAIAGLKAALAFGKKLLKKE
jgi:hypothetical protein